MRYDLNRDRPFFFVGRDEALSTLRNELRRCGGGRVGYVCGPEAIGKSALLREFGRWLDAQGVPFTWLDSRYYHELTDTSLRALFDVLPVERSTLGVLVLDHIEALSVSESTLVELLQTRLGPKTLFLITGRSPLGSAWRTVIESSRFFEVHPGPMHIHESVTFLRRQRVNGAGGLQLATQSFGYPLPLAVIADIARFRPSLTVDPNIQGMALVEALVPQFLAAPPAYDGRVALLTACLVPRVDAPMLRRALARPSVHGVHRWLAACAVAEVGRDAVRFPERLRAAGLAHLIRHGDPLLSSLLERLYAHIEVDVLVRLSGHQQVSMTA